MSAISNKLTFAGRKELHKHVDVAARREVVTDDRAEKRQTAHCIAATELRDAIVIDLDLEWHGDVLRSSLVHSQFSPDSLNPPCERA
jgi:hypothetical protein